MVSEKRIQSLSIPLKRDLFLRSLIRELSGTLEEVVGFEEASGYISLVGQKIGDWINELYKEELGVETLSREQVAEVLVDLKKRIHGDFRLVDQGDERLTFCSNKCPFEDQVIGRPSMCMMTSNVFGVIAANNLGYAKVSLVETIANKDRNCRVVVYLQHTPEARGADGREYFRD